MASVSMAPMIDMVFLLLVFFMTASAMSQAGSKLELPLPESENAKVAQDFSNRIILSLDQDGQVHVGSKPLERNELSAFLSDFGRDRPDGSLSIRAHKDTAFSAIKEVMKIASEAGVENYLYASYERSGD